MNFRRSGRVTSFAPDSAGNRWWLIHPALEVPRLVESVGDTVIHTSDESDTFRALDRAAQRTQLVASWYRVVAWAQKQGLGGAVGEAMDPSERDAFAELGFGSRPADDAVPGGPVSEADAPSFLAGSRLVSGGKTAAALRDAIDLAAVYLCAYSPERELVVVYDSSWDAVLVSSVESPTL